MRTACTLKLSDFILEAQFVFREMCRRVCANAEELDYGHKEELKDEWFTKYQWTQEELEDFIEWFYNHLRTSAKARKAFGVYGRSKKACRKKAAIMYWYTWDIKSGDSLK